MFTQIKTDQEIENMRVGGQMLATVLRVTAERVVPGITTKELSDFAENELKKLGGTPAFLGYHGFPAGLCVSVNNEVVHGIPGKKQIADGDVVSLDFGVLYKGLITDSALTVIVGEVPQEVADLVHKTEQSMFAGIDVLHDGVKVGDIGAAVQKTLEQGGYGIVRDLVGHGVGHELHEEPNIPNVGIVGQGPILRAGMTIAIEPMATLGTHRVYVDSDNWTIKTEDSSIAAHFEHTVLITDSGFEILTDKQ
jgi:methionyl aminopeptidase